MLQLAQPHYVIQHSIVSSSSTSLQGIYDVVTLQMHIMCQDLQALHLKCFLCQSNNLMCSHFKANPRPGLKYVTVADITLHMNMFSVYYYQVLRCNRNLSHDRSILICQHCLFVQTIAACSHMYRSSADSYLVLNVNNVYTLSKMLYQPPTALDAHADITFHIYIFSCVLYINNSTETIDTFHMRIPL